MKRWDAFFPYVIPECTGVTEMLAEQKIRQAAIEFCTASRIDLRRLDPLQIIAGVGTYELDAPINTSIIQISEVWVGDRKKLAESTVHELSHAPTHWRTETGEPTHYVSEEQGSITLFRIPTTTGEQLSVSAYVTPSQTSTGVEDGVFERHLQHIADGAKAVLMAMPGVSWGSPNMSIYYGSLFARHKNDARLDGKRQYGRPNQSVRLRSF